MLPCDLAQVTHVAATSPTRPRGAEVAQCALRRLRRAVTSLSRRAGRQVNVVLDHLGYRVSRLQATASMEAALRRTAARKIPIGSVVGQLQFDESDPIGGLASSEAGRGTIVVPATTIDHEVERLGLPGPYLIKLDTHGFELPILQARATLARSSLHVIEVYNFTLTPVSLRFHEMCAYLAPLGFRPIDLCDPMYPPTDGAFWQCDMFGSNEYA